MTWDRGMHDGSRSDPRPDGLPEPGVSSFSIDDATKAAPVTVSSILDRFARKLTELDARSVRLGGQALSLGDPRDIAGQIRGLADNMEAFTQCGEGGDVTAEALGAQCIAFLLSRARVDELRVDAGGEDVA